MSDQVIENNLKIYQTSTGIVPFFIWLSKLRDERAKAKILVRLGRVRLGNLGNRRSVGGGVFEMMIDYGPGYRIYFAEIRVKEILILIGGDKKTQRLDIRTANKYFSSFKKERNYAHY